MKIKLALGLILLPFLAYSQKYMCELKTLDTSQRVVDRNNFLIELDDDGGSIIWPDLGDLKFSFGIELGVDAEDDYYYWSELSKNGVNLVSSDHSGIPSGINNFENTLFTQEIKLKCRCQKVN